MSIPDVLVSAAVASGLSAELLDRWLADRPFELLVCPILIGELRDVPQRPKFRRWITTIEAADFIDRLAREAESWVDPTDVPTCPPSPGTQETTISSLCTEALRPTCSYLATRTSSTLSLPTSSPSRPVVS